MPLYWFSVKWTTGGEELRSQDDVMLLSFDSALFSCRFKFSITRSKGFQVPVLQRVLRGWQTPNSWSKGNESFGWCFKVLALARPGNGRGLVSGAALEGSGRSQ
jgi:hypothetical protein